MPARKKNSTQLRGAVNNIILESLYSGEKYGYEIIKEVEEKTNGKIKLKQPSLYSSLKRFESKNYIKSYWADSDIGGKRHYYSLTDEGLKYYKKNILKESDSFENDADEEITDDIFDNNNYNETAEESDDEYLEDQINAEDDGYEIDDSDNIQNDYSKYSYNVDEKVKQLLANKDNSENEELLDELYESNDSEQVYTEEDLVQDQAEQELKEETPVDHEFRKPTPITDEIIKNNIENDFEEETKEPNTTTSYTILDNTNNVYDDITNIEDKVSDNALDDLLYHDPEENEDNTYIKHSTEEKVDVEEQEQEQKPQIYTDEYGITKMYYPDEDKKQTNNKIFDNVVFRTNANTLFDNNKNTTTPNKNHVDLDELSDEEREHRTTSFMQKFENRTKELTAQKGTSVKQEETEKEEVPRVDYKKVLTGLYDVNNEYQPETSYISDEEETYVPSQPSNEETEDDYNTYPITQETETSNKDYNVKIYTKEKTKSHDNKYLLVNKAKFVFGLTMLIFMLLQVTLMLVVFKNKEVLMQKQYWVFQTAYILIALISLYFCIPVFISPNKQATNTFKLGYMLMFGVLAFFVVVILSYAINTFMGMEIDTINYYIPTLLVPIVLALNFVFGPIIYKIISQNKKLY